MAIINNVVSESPRTNDALPHESTNNGLIDGIPVHNARFSRISLFIDCLPRLIDVYNAIVWRMDSETVDIAQFGQNLSSYILYTAEWDFTVLVDGNLNIRRKTSC